MSPDYSVQMTESNQKEDIGKKTQTGKNQMETLELESIITDMKNSLDRLNSRCELEEERIHGLGSRIMELVQPEGETE